MTVYLINEKALKYSKYIGFNEGREKDKNGGAETLLCSLEEEKHFRWDLNESLKIGEGGDIGDISDNYQKYIKDQLSYKVNFLLKI